MKKMKLYIAYGSNMNIEQMSFRCPTARILSNGTLRNWKLRFYGNPGAAVATIEKAENHKVPVLIWKIDAECERALDVYEGYPRLYRKEYIPVEIDGEECEAMVYIMNDFKGFTYCNPSLHYVRIIESGYRSCGYDTTFLYRAIMNNKKEINKTQNEMLKP